MSNSVSDIPSDLLKSELATKGNTLSFWKCESLEDTKDTIKAIILSTTSIEKTQFIIFDDNILDKYDIDRDLSEEGKTGYLGFSKLHVNLCSLTYEKIGKILEAFKEVLGNEKHVPILTREEIKGYIREVFIAGLIDENNVDEHLMADINKYGLNS